MVEKKTLNILVSENFIAERRAVQVRWGASNGHVWTIFETRKVPEMGDGIWSSQTEADCIAVMEALERARGAVRADGDRGLEEPA